MSNYRFSVPTLLLVEQNKNVFLTRVLWIIFFVSSRICCDEVNAHVGLHAGGTPTLRKRGGVLAWKLESDS